jgi:hypothetical protein
LSEFLVLRSGAAFLRLGLKHLVVGVHICAFGCETLVVDFL